MIIASKFTLSLNVIVKMTKNLFRSTKNLRLVFDRSLSHIGGSGSKVCCKIHWAREQIQIGLQRPDSCTCIRHALLLIVSLQ